MTTLSAMTLPTETSMPRTRITRNSPRPKAQTMALCASRFWRLRTETKCGAKSPNTARRVTRMMIGPDCSSPSSCRTRLVVSDPPAGALAAAPISVRALIQAAYFTTASTLPATTSETVFSMPPAFSAVRTGCAGTTTSFSTSLPRARSAAVSVAVLAITSNG